MPIPTELTDRKQWVNWQYGELRPDGKRSKEPYIPGTNRKASSTSPATWGEFEKADDNGDLGYVFTKEDGIAGIDLDHCIKDGKVLPWAKKIVEDFNSYTEISPSQTGLHIFVKTSELLKGLNKGDIEIYTHERYFTMTGWHIAGPETIEDRTEFLNKFHAKVTSSPPQCVGAVSEPIAQGLTSAITPVEGKMERLEAGDWRGAGYPDQTPADWAYITGLKDKGKTREQVEDLYRKSGLYTTRDVKEAERKLGIALDKVFKNVKARRRGGIVSMTIVKETYGDLKWSWKDWIPKGHVTMVAGAQGVGKSYFAAALISAMGGYQPWPDKSLNPRPTNVLLTETEGMKGEYVKRLQSLGCDESKGKVLFGPQYDVYEHEFLDDPGFALDLGAIAAEWNPGMLVVDSLSGAHVGKENDASMRKLLQHCTLWASELDIPIILVHHERKRNQLESAKTTIDRVRGSSTITQFCRSIIGIWREGEDDTVRIEIIKSNFAAPPEALGMQIISGVPKFIDPPQVVVKGAPATQEAIDFLRKVLAAGPVEILRVKEQASGRKITKSTLYRARDKMGVTGVKILGRMCWVLPPEFTINIGTKDED